MGLVAVGLTSLTKKKKRPVRDLPDVEPARAFTCAHEKDVIPPRDPEADSTLCPCSLAKGGKAFTARPFGLSASRTPDPHCYSLRPTRPTSRKTEADDQPRTSPQRMHSRRFWISPEKKTSSTAAFPVATTTWAVTSTTVAVSAFVAKRPRSCPQVLPQGR